MNFTKTVPTLPMPVRGRPNGAGWFSVFVQGEWSPPQYRAADFPWRHDIEWHVELCVEGPRIEPPQPVPGEVMDVRRRWKDAARGIGEWDNQHTVDIQTICDFIDHIAPPEVPPLPNEELELFSDCCKRANDVFVTCRSDAEGLCHMTIEEWGDFHQMASLGERLLATIRERDATITRRGELIAWAGSIGVNGTKFVDLIEFSEPKLIDEKERQNARDFLAIVAGLEQKQ